MKKVFLISVLGLFYFSGVLLADKTGVGAERNQDRTGSPVATSSTQQCDKCHSGGNFNPAISLRLKDNNGDVVTEYNGGESYTYEVEVTGSSTRFGFQSVALLSSNANAGNMTASSSNAKITIINSRRYAEHTTQSTTGLFVMNWTAPVPGSGTVNFYASGNCVNNMNNSTGDSPIVATPLTITESAISGISEKNDAEMISVFPNPSSTNLNINLPEGNVVNLEIIDISGRKVFEHSGLTSQNNIDISTLNNGIFFIVISGDMTATKKFIKK